MANISIFVWIVAAIIIFIVSFLTFWVLGKAYSRKWEHEERNRFDNT